MTLPSLDILMITHARPAYTEQSLRALLDSCRDGMRVRVWHNGDHAETLDVVHGFADHPALACIHHSPENAYVREPTNWLFSTSDADLLSVVADDCVVVPEWAEPLRVAHADVDVLGVLACWHFAEEDFDEYLADRKTRTFGGMHQVVLNPWVQGSGVVMKRACVEALGPIPAHEHGFTSYCMRIAAAGWRNGWYRPIIPIAHLDDPRCPGTQLTHDAALADHLPLSARVRGVATIDDWIAHLQRSALEVLAAPPQPWLYVGMGKKLRRLWMRIHKDPLPFARAAERRAA